MAYLPPAGFFSPPATQNARTSEERRLNTNTNNRLSYARRKAVNTPSAPSRAGTSSNPPAPARAPTPTRTPEERRLKTNEMNRLSYAKR